MKKRTLDQGYVYDTPLGRLIYSKGFNQFTLAEKCGMCFQAIQWLVSGKTTNPRLYTIQMVADTLQVSCQDIIDLIHEGERGKNI